MKNATACAMSGIVYLFALRFAGTFFPGAFRLLLVAQIATVLSLIAGAALLCFYIYFYTDYVKAEQQLLKKAAAGAIIGSCLVLIVFVKDLIVVFNAPVPLVQNAVGYIDTLLPWLSSILLLIFFIIFHRESRHGPARLRNALCAAITGLCAQTLLLTVIFINYVLSGKAMILLQYSGIVWSILTLIVAFTFAALLYFFVTFYRTHDIVMSSRN